MRFLKIPGIFVALLIAVSCQPEGFIKDPSAKLQFSMDTVYFDTVFTELATVTRRFTVKNPYKEYIKVSSIELAGGQESVYRINVDGLPGTEFRNLEIAPGDSLFIFVNAILDPNNSNGILLRKDSVIFVTNDNTQDVDLVAWGQDVHILRDTIFNSQVWTREKPYLILGYAALDSAQDLTIEEGTRIYFHRDSYLLIAGTLTVNGTKENPVVFRGDRLEQLYNDIPGQWTGIIFYPWSRNNFIEYAEIKHGLVGIVLQSTFDDVSIVDLTLQNTRIQHVSSYGIRAAYSRITGHNNLITNCGISAIALEGGGNYEFSHTTVANWFDYNSRSTPSVIFTNYVILTNEDGAKITIVKDLEKASFANSIIYGSNGNEILWSSEEGKLMEYRFENCLIKLDTTKIPITGNPSFINCINYRDPLFLNTSAYDFHFDTLEVSPARDAGKLSIGEVYPLDLDSVSRIADRKPDLGVYEFFRPE